MSAGDTEKQPLTPVSSRSPGGADSAMDCFLRHVTTIARLCGMVVLAVMWAATVTSLQGKTNAPTYVGYYLIAASIVVTFFEVIWVIDKMACCVRQGCCCRCWSIVLWVDGWRKFLLYTALSVLLFLQGLQGLFLVVTGFCLMVLACLYLVTSFRPRDDSQYGHQPIPDSAQQTALPPAVPVVRHEMSTQTDVIAEGDAWTKGRVTQRVQTDTRDSKHSTPSGTEQSETGTNPFEADNGVAVAAYTAVNDPDTTERNVTPTDSSPSDPHAQ
ncbi:hypothetical protein V1264_018051 [Littorina saxatilis]|uniref:Transmembrane protein n=2 Tax=Littorina saxatilis TaxID=31220 RepID=A0AAN9GDR0_9CAEN